MWVAATGHLLYNESLTLDLATIDEEVDEHERVIRRLVYESVEHSPGRDLELGLMIVSVVQDGERIGDLSKSIAALGSLADKPLIGPHTYGLRALRDRITAMFDRTAEGFVDGDVGAAAEVMRENRAVKKQFRRFTADLAASSDVTVNEAVILATSAIMMGRVSSHLSNVSSTVVLPFEQIRGSSRKQEQG
jgi:phosphate uptake regulator